ncbi:CitMHS domain-containing protein [Mycena sanguinolenta]|uniref:CitMHS domain-containing protein n=1 Tax=Mycena sanguinolenta TaxID=230812 RepID=A0A8H7DLF0_9AGAR|nr:CitMHS domain-containing protein [Mycena sanguinolenta]
MPTGFSIATLVIFICSISFVIHPLSIRIRLPYVGPKRVALNLTTAPVLAIAILWASQCLGPAQIRDGIVGTGEKYDRFHLSLRQSTDGVKPYNILLLFISLAYMAITLDVTGVLQAAAFWVSNRGGSNGWKLYLYFYVMLTVLSVFLGNDPVILSGTAFLVYYTKVSELNPTSWLISEFAAANTASMVLFVGNPTNVVICEGFEVNNAAFTAYTILPFLACNVACFAALGFQFRNPKYLPRKLNNSADLDVRSVLLDPKGALVGGVLLGTCLIVIIIVSFFHVDVWKISLPFAVAKFIFDLAWDHYRFVHRIPMLGHAPRSSGQNGPDTTAEKDEDVMLQALKRRLTVPTAGEEPEQPHNSPTPRQVTPVPTAPVPNTSTPALKSPSPSASFPLAKSFLFKFNNKRARFAAHFPTFSTALPRLPFALIPFAFSQFILIEALAHQGWIDVFASWLRHATHRNPASPYPTIWIIGILGIILCNLSGTNIGATILLTKVVRAAFLPSHTERAAAISLAVASNIGAVSFTFSASLAGLLWRGILKQKGIIIGQRSFAFWNTLPLVAMGVAGLGVVCAEMAVLQ